MDSQKTAVIVTTIQSPTDAMQSLRDGCNNAGYQFIVVGDLKTPDFKLDGCEYLNVGEQKRLGLSYSNICPVNSYARKNIGYLLAIHKKAEVIIETDDDNFPCDSFFATKHRMITSAKLENVGWVNIYRYFTDDFIWPRGLPLDQIRNAPPQYNGLSVSLLDCPIQQGLVNGDPDVDAIYRLLMPLPFSFKDNKSVGLAAGAWCPFNSQNIRWWKDAFPLLYLPAYCSIRLTDIWRSFVAQVIAHINGWAVLFHAATAYQKRNVHNYMKDFADEIPGYLNNQSIMEILSSLVLRPGLSHIPENMLKCYSSLAGLGVIKQNEMELLNAWLADIESLSCNR